MEELIVFSTHKPFTISCFEDAIFYSKRKFSINQLTISGNISEENLEEAIKKAEQICRLAGMNSHQHFQKIYVYEPNNENVHIDFKMSRSAFNLLIMQLQQLNENRAKWLWELAEG
jgi:hypothetical protein